MAETKVEIAHRWQDFRIRCLELAVKGGATEQNMIEVADKIGTYIMTQSERELSAAKAADALTSNERDGKLASSLPKNFARSFLASSQVSPS